MTGSRQKDLIIIAIAAAAAITILAVFFVFRSGYGQPAISIMYQVENATSAELLVDERLLPRDFDSEAFEPEDGWETAELNLYPAGETRRVTITAQTPLQSQADQFAITALHPASREVVFQKIYEFGELEESGATISLASN